MSIRTIIAITMFFKLTSAYADDAQYIKAAKTTWSAFLCTAFSGWMMEYDESDRLMSLGLSNGRYYYAGVVKGEHKLTSIFDDIPEAIWMAQIKVISPDFSLGTVWVASTESARKIVGQKYFGENANDGARKAVAKRAYDQYNCSFVR